MDAPPEGVAAGTSMGMGDVAHGGLRLFRVCSGRVLQLCAQTGIKHTQSGGIRRFRDNVVGETGFEPAT